MNRFIINEVQITLTASSLNILLVRLFLLLLHVQKKHFDERKHEKFMGINVQRHD